MLNKLKSRLTKFDKFATSFFSVHHYSTEKTSKKAKEYTHFGNETVKTKEKSKKGLYTNLRSDVYFIYMTPPSSHQTIGSFFNCNIFI